MDTTGKYGKSLSKVVENLKLARPFAEDAKQQEVIDLLVSYYETGDLHTSTNIPLHGFRTPTHW